MAVYVTSDLHFRHSNILKMERGQFSSIEEHDEYIINRWNSVIYPEDTVYVLGDVGFYDIKVLAKLIRQLKGHKILVMGNHDHFSCTQAVEILGFEQAFNGPIYYNTPEFKSGKIILSHEPVLEAYQNAYVINVHGHLHGSKLGLKNYFNVNISGTQYCPVKMAQFVRFTYKYCKSRRETYGNEWYFKDYVQDAPKN